MRFRQAAFGMLVVVVSVVSPAVAAHAARGGHAGNTQPPSSLALTSETVQMNPSLPGVSCLTEDDYDQRTFAGALSGSYTTEYDLCGLNTDGFTAGGIGLESTISLVGQLTDLTITAPDGTTHHAVLMQQSTYRGVTTDEYAVCYVPLYYAASDTSSDPLPGGTWTLQVSGQASSATWVTTALMADVAFQEANCPSSEQNIG